MAADDLKNKDRGNGSRRRISPDRARIKNITNEVHPEYSASGRRSSGRKAAVRKKNLQEADDESITLELMLDESEGMTNDSKETVKKDGNRRRQRAARLRRARRRRRRRQILRAAALCLIAVALVMTVLTVRNYNSGTRHDSKGLKAYENGDYETAIAEFKEAVAYDEQNTDYYIHLGMAYIEQKSYDEALGYFNQAENYAESDNDTALVNRGRGIACLYQGDYETAISWFTKALAASDQNVDIRVDTLYYKAEAEEKYGDYEAAVQSYGLIIELEDDAGARMLRGMAYMELNDYASAETDLYAAVEQSRKSYSIYRALYSALEAQGKTDEADEVLNDALELSGSSGEDYFNRGMIYLDLNDYDSAVDMLTQSYQKGYAAALLGLGEASISQGDYETARSYYETFFAEADFGSLDTTLVCEAYNQYAVCLLSAGEYEAAAAACESGLSYNDRDTDADLSLNLIIAYEYLGRWEDAYNSAKSYVGKYPDDTDAVREYTFLESRVTQ